MMERIRLSSEAETELAEAIRWYEEYRPGLGNDLLAAIDHTLSLIAGRPDMGRSVPDVQRPDARRLLVPRFPYQIVYRVDAHQIIVVAVAHLMRRPGYWMSRT